MPVCPCLLTGPPADLGAGGAGHGVPGAADRVRLLGPGAGQHHLQQLRGPRREDDQGVDRVATQNHTQLQSQQRLPHDLPPEAVSAS